MGTGTPSFDLLKIKQWCHDGVRGIVLVNFIVEGSVSYIRIDHWALGFVILFA